MNDCPFCHPASERIFHLGEHILGVWDAFPVNPGHALLITKRHVADWFDATPEEQQELTQAIALARKEIDSRYASDGFNIGLNAGEHAGQTIPHLHLHVIPRLRGDVADPRGGVRNVIPARGNYLSEDSKSEDGSSVARDREESELTRSSRADQDLAKLRQIVTGDTSDPLLPHLIENLDRASALDLAVAFIMPSGLNAIFEHLRDLLHRGGQVRILTGDYMGVTDPDCLRALLDLRTEPSGRGNLELRVFTTRNRTFHPKAYIFKGTDEADVAFIGSSNLSETALRTGVEWNYRVVPRSEASGFEDIARSFNDLFRHPDTSAITQDWINEYESRRQPTEATRDGTPTPEPTTQPPEPHLIQKEALAALAASREEGNEAGLVVLATGLGKTWLAAFDSRSSERFRRVLFVAHRDEILSQARDTFRRIRPQDRLGMFTGKEKTASSEVVFASVQTLARKDNLRRFSPSEFDYIVVDEFHHASAKTYRNILDYFAPQFLLGLTATPERTDGGDLLGLCGENLVYSCGMDRGIELGLLSPFHYFGVPDEVDYRNIPWRNKRFDPAALENAVATESRAKNAWQQWVERAGDQARTLAFCCSVRHAEFMAEYFRKNGATVACVHSGPTSDPRASSLEALRAGTISVVFAVDIFNEGVDIPAVDAVLMLRPTESQILWLQQFGRGLRRAEGKKQLTVVDYIGNHRAFLNKTISLFGSIGLTDDPGGLAAALKELEQNAFELPAGCEITYELEAVKILRGLLQIPKNEASHALLEWYRGFGERTGERPRAVEAFHEGYSPKAARKLFGSWLGLVKAEGDLDKEMPFGTNTEAEAFLSELEKTPMSKSFKMLVIMALLNEDQLPGRIGIEALSTRFARLARRNATLKAEVEADLESATALQSYLERNPISAWSGGKGTSGHSYFEYSDGVFSSTFSVPSAARDQFQDAAREIADWRLAEYLARKQTTATGSFQARVDQENGAPVLILPNRKNREFIPQGFQKVLAGGMNLRANFTEIPINALRETEDGPNKLPELIESWFGNNAGFPNSDFHVSFQPTADGAWKLEPVGKRNEGLELWRSYDRKSAIESLGLNVQPAAINKGIARIGELILLFVTLTKDGMDSAHQYGDHFLSDQVLEWQTSPSYRRESQQALHLKDPSSYDRKLHLFVRDKKKYGSQSVPFIYCGQPSFLRWDGDKPITLQWKVDPPIPRWLWSRFKIGEN